MDYHETKSPFISVLFLETSNLTVNRPLWISCNLGEVLRGGLSSANIGDCIYIILFIVSEPCQKKARSLKFKNRAKSILILYGYCRNGMNLVENHNLPYHRYFSFAFEAE